MADTQPLAPSAAESEILPNPDTHASSFPEWADAGSGLPIRQGDVLSVVPATDSLWRQLAVVITADCDLAKEKHGGALTCVPVLRLSDYLLVFRYEKQREGLIFRAAVAALDLFRMANPAQEVPNISAERLRQWIIEEDPQRILDSLSEFAVPDSMASLLTETKRLCGDRPTTVTAAIESIARSRVALGDFKDPNKARSAISNDLASTLRALPGDVLLLNEISASHTEGYAVYLRRAFEVRESSVAVSQYRLPHDATYMRISRLRAPYLYALTQQFGAVFSAIGLPNTYEQARDSLGARIKAGEY